ncbi:protein kinase domain-containing protein [Sorangium sp. So ce1000]|uniref:serine/threonine-protein kinase n=1 Tax=Sorangium sp. So ce1000 TaxID=3133325 RepID=UPI003F63A80C
MTRVHPEGFRPEALVGQILRGKWRLDRLLGFGGMAMVYAGTHRNGMRGAVKILRRELSEDEEARSRFLREGYVANRVDHPGIVRVLDDDVTDDGSVFLVMELLEGETVDARRAREPGGVLGANEVLAIADDLLDVLAVAHDRGIVHRDLKPDNLFLTRQGQLKVLDFGIARLRELSSPTNASTRAGTLMGTPQFMPPEQAKGQWDRVDPRSDLWAVGSTMFQLLSGRYVHEAETLPLLLLAAMTQPAPPVGSVLPALPPPIAGVMDVALAFDPERRWPNARAMQRALRQARGGVAIDPAQGARSEPPPRALMHSDPGRALMHSDPGRSSAQARGPGSGPRGTEFAAAGTASGVSAGAGAAGPGTVSPVVERSAGMDRPAPRAAATGALLAGAGVLAVGVLVALVWWQRAGAAGSAEDAPHGSTVEAEPRPAVGAGEATATPDSAGSLGAGAQPAPSGDAVPAIAPSAPATTPAPEAAPVASASASARAAPASTAAAAPRPAAGGRARSPGTATKAPAAPTPALAPTPTEDPYNRRR